MTGGMVMGGAEKGEVQRGETCGRLVQRRKGFGKAKRQSQLGWKHHFRGKAAVHPRVNFR